MSLEGDCHKVEITPNLELLVTFGIIRREFYLLAEPVGYSVFKSPWATAEELGGSLL
jgi:hypothetical protein